MNARKYLDRIKYHSEVEAYMDLYQEDIPSLLTATDSYNFRQAELRAWNDRRVVR